jgi:hypothetical protein
MKRKLLKTGLIFFTLAGLYCVHGRVSLLSDVVGGKYSADQAEWYRFLYTAGIAISSVSFLFCLAILVTTSKKKA